jgi:hypothetical protein
MAQYSPELLAALRQRYEQTDQPMTALAAEFGIGITTLQTLVRKNGWSPRSQRLRHCPPLLEPSLPPPERGRACPRLDRGAPAEAESDGGRVGIDAEFDSEASPTHEATPSPTLPLAGGGSETAPRLSPAERLEALVEKEIAAEEATRAALGIRPRSRNEAERCARTIVKLTHALQTIQKLRGGTGARENEPPRDIEALRGELARRLNGLIDSQIGDERVALGRQISGLTDDELRELIALGRERGMEALLRPAEETT